MAPETLPAAPPSSTTPPRGFDDDSDHAGDVRGARQGASPRRGQVQRRQAAGDDRLREAPAAPATWSLEIGVGKSIEMEVSVAVAAGDKKTVKVKPNKALAKAMKAHPKAKASARLRRRGRQGPGGEGRLVRVADKQ